MRVLLSFIYTHSLCNLNVVETEPGGVFMKHSE
jgi:hypothetical protein